MARAGQVSGEQFSKALQAEVDKTKIDSEKIMGALHAKMAHHGQAAGEAAGMSFGTGFHGQLARSIPGVSAFASTMAGYEGAAAKTGALAGRALGTAFTAAAGGLVGAAAYTLYKGFERYETIDAATHRLQNLSKTLQASGRAGLDVAGIMKTVNDVVQGTPIGLDKAMGAVTVALGSGIKQGDELKRYLTDIADAAGYSGRTFEEIALVFGQVQAKGRLMGEEVLQLAEKNIPAAAWLKDTFKLTGDEYERMQEKGQISLKALEMAIEQHAGGQAKAMGETIQGAISEVQSSIARAGANFLGAIFGKPTDQNNTMVEALKSIKERLDEVGAWVVAHQKEIHDFFTTAAEVGRDVAKVLGEVATLLGEHPGLVYAGVAAWGAFKAVNIAGTIAESVAQMKLLQSTMASTAAAAPAAGAKIATAFSVVTAGISIAIGELVYMYNSIKNAKFDPPRGTGLPPNVTQQQADVFAQGGTTGLYSVPRSQGGLGPEPGDPDYRAPGSTPGGLPSIAPWKGLTWDWSKGGWVDAQGNPPTAPAPGAGPDDSNPFLPPRDAHGDGKPHLPKAPVLPYDTSLPAGFDNLPMSASLYSAESSYMDAHNKLLEKRARLAQLERDGNATEQDVLKARNDVVEAQRDLQQNELRLNEQRNEILTKGNKALKGLSDELGQIGVSIDNDFGISKGLAGIAENITRFVASLAAAPILGTLGAQQMAAGFKPGEAGQGAVGMLAASGRLGPQYQIQGSLAGGIGTGAGDKHAVAAAAGLPGASPGSAVAVPAGFGGAGMSARDFAHNVMMPYWQSLGLTVGDHAADQYGEHQNGALDIMVPSLQAGQDVLNQVLSDPNIYGAIFNRNSYGYGHGNVPQPYTGDNPHTDHVHAWYRPGNAGNIPIPGAAPPSFGPRLPGLTVAPAGFGPGGAPLAPNGGPGGPTDPHTIGPQPGVPGPGLPGLPSTANPTKIGGVPQPQGHGSGGASLGGLAMGALQAGIGAAGMGASMFGGQAGAAAAQAMMQLINRTIQFGSQAVGIGVQGLAETFLPAGSDLAANNWITKIAGGLAGATPMLPNLAGKEEGGPTPEQVVGQGQGLDGNPAGLPNPVHQVSNDNSKNVTVTNNNTFNAANMNENSMANTVAMHAELMNA